MVITDSRRGQLDLVVGLLEITKFNGQRPMLAIDKSVKLAIGMLDLRCAKG